MSGFYMFIQLILSLSILVIVHEWGHFFAARKFGIKVEKFYLFMDVFKIKLFKIFYKGCEYGIGWLPIGGYVKIKGMVDESLDGSQAKKAVQPDDFIAKPIWQRLIVILAGAAVNIIVGILILWSMFFFVGEEKILNNKLEHGLVPSPLMERIGFQTGDKILSVNGEQLNFLRELRNPKTLFNNNNYVIERGGSVMNLTVDSNIISLAKDRKELQTELFTPRIKLGVITKIVADSPFVDSPIEVGDSLLSVQGVSVQYYDELKKITNQDIQGPVNITYMTSDQEKKKTSIYLKKGLPMGIVFSISSLPTTKIKYGFFDSFTEGISKALFIISVNMDGIGKIVTGKLDASKTLSGPIGIAQMFGGEFDWVNFWFLTAMLSLILAFMNVLPIPALDGGHALMLIVEWFYGKPLPIKFQNIVQVIGLAILLLLTVFVFYTDIYNLFV